MAKPMYVGICYWLKRYCRCTSYRKQKETISFLRIGSTEIFVSFDLNTSSLLEIFETKGKII